MKMLFFCKFPPPFTGQTIGTHVIFKSLETYVDLEKIDTSHGRIKPGTYSFKQIRYVVLFSMQMLMNLLSLHTVVTKKDIDVVYIVASPSLLGLLRNWVTTLVVGNKTHKIVAHVRNGNYHTIFGGAVSRYLANQVAQSVDKFIFLSKSLEDRVAPYLPVSKCSIVRNSIDESVRCSRAEVKTKIASRVEDNVLRVLYLSNMIESKGYMDVARALSALHEHTDGVSLTANFVGAWPNRRSRTAFEQFIAENSLSGIVDVHGRVEDRETIKEAYLEADVFVLPTYYPNEAQPRSIIEAFNAGTPVIATEHASIPEYVFDDNNGYLVDKQSPFQIKNCLEALSNQSNWQNKARSARRTYEEMFSPDAVQDAMLQAIRESK